MSSNRTGGAQEGSNSNNNDAGQPLEQAQPVIYKVMSPAVGVNELRQRMVETMREVMWLARESRIPGMLTIQIESTGRENAISGNFRYALTNKGWENASGLPNSDVRVDFNDVRSRMEGAVTVENAAAHVEDFFKQVARDFPDLELTRANLCLPRAGMQSLQNVYMEYVTVESLAPLPLPSLGGAVGGMFNEQDRQRQRARGETLIQDRELLALISDSRTNAVMVEPVIMVADGTSCNKTSLGDGREVGRDYYPDTKLQNIIKYLKEINRVDATAQQREDALVKLEGELTDQMTGNIIQDAFTLSTGHTYDRLTVAGIMASATSHNDPNTGARVHVTSVPRQIRIQLEEIRDSQKDLEDERRPLEVRANELDSQVKRMELRKQTDGEHAERYNELKEELRQVREESAPFAERARDLAERYERIVVEQVAPLVNRGGEERPNRAITAIAAKWPEIKVTAEAKIAEQRAEVVDEKAEKQEQGLGGGPSK